MAENEIKINVRADTKDAQAGLTGIHQRLKNMQRPLRNASIAMGGVAVALGAMGKSFIGAALEQQRAEKTLAAVVRATGASWESQRQSILATTAALQDKTNFGDEEQIRVLSQLVPVFGNVSDAMAALPTILDAASASGKSLETVASTMGRALSGATNTSIILGTTFDATATRADRLRIAQEKIGGAAAANVDPFKQLGNTIGDLKEQIGLALIPMLTPLVDKLKSLAERLQEVNPLVLKIVAGVGLATFAFAAIAAPVLAFLAMLPFIIAGIGSLTVAFGALSIAIWPVTLTVLAIAAAITAGILIWKKWDTIVQAFSKTLEFLVGLAGTIWEKAKGIGKALIDGIIESIKGQIARVKDAAGWVFDAIKEGLGKLWPFSPSKTGVEVGEGLMQGIAKGIADKEAATIARVERMSQALADAAAIAIEQIQIMPSGRVAFWKQTPSLSPELQAGSGIDWDMRYNAIMERRRNQGMAEKGRRALEAEVLGQDFKSPFEKLLAPPVRGLLSEAEVKVNRFSRAVELLKEQGESAAAAYRIAKATLKEFGDLASILQPKLAAIGMPALVPPPTNLVEMGGPGVPMGGAIGPLHRAGVLAGLAAGALDPEHAEYLRGLADEQNRAGLMALAAGLEAGSPSRIVIENHLNIDSHEIDSSSANNAKNEEYLPTGA